MATEERRIILRPTIKLRHEQVLSALQSHYRNFWVRIRYFFEIKNSNEMRKFFDRKPKNHKCQSSCLCGVRGFSPYDTTRAAEKIHTYILPKSQSAYFFSFRNLVSGLLRSKKMQFFGRKLKNAKSWFWPNFARFFTFCHFFFIFIKN